MSQKNILKKSRDHHILAKKRIFKFETSQRNIFKTMHAIQNLKVAYERTSKDLWHSILRHVAYRYYEKLRKFDFWNIANFQPSDWPNMYICIWFNCKFYEDIDSVKKKLVTPTHLQENSFL